MILRLFNLSADQERVVVKFDADVKAIDVVDLKEEFIEKLEVKAGKAQVAVGSNKICTLKIVL